MVRLDDNQQRYAYIGAAVAAVGFVVAHASNFPDSIGFAVLGLAMAAFLVVGARRRSVVLTGAAAFVISFGPWGGLWFLGAPYIALGGLLMFRASKQAAEAAGPREPRRKKEKARPQAEVADKKRPPDKSKRYTPPTTRSRRSGGT